MQLWMLLVLATVVRANPKKAMAQFQQAISRDDQNMIRKAVEDGADMNFVGAGGQTALVNAVLRDKLETVKTLLDLGADVTIPEKDGYTVMHAAGFQGRAEVLRVLGAFEDKKTGAKIDIMEGHADGYYPFHRACWGDHPKHAETVQVFLDLGVAYDLEARNGKTCLDMTPNTTTKKILRIAERQQQSQDQRERDISEEEDEEEL